KVLGARFWFTLPANQTPPFEALPEESGEGPEAAAEPDTP
ncbi:MAG: two-component system, OmpR family, sensor histidine kinase KdpD, partial [Caballeronia mineralivorans]|nr:two-component system, OmpR family, sensor histidine kinase KdpD [Caballeronia mineralivorans]